MELGKFPPEGLHPESHGHFNHFASTKFSGDAGYLPRVEPFLHMVKVGAAILS